MLDVFSWGYLIFTIVVMAVYWLLAPVKFRPYVLMAFGIILLFFQSTDNAVVSAKLFVITLIYLSFMWYFGFLIHSAKQQSTRKFFTIAGVALSASLLAYYKYGVFGDVHQLSIEGTASGTTSVLAPLGISYFTFRVIHYLVELYKGKYPQASYSRFLLYVTFFPTVIAGPIERYDRFNPQTEKGTTFDSNEFLYGAGRVVQGLFKKLVISATLYQMVIPYYTAVTPTGEVTLSTWQIWVIHNIYLMYLYMDFSGYSDIAIGTARMFGYRIMENFNWAVFQPSIARFWGNWHISLTRWLRDYIYIPLGGSRKGFGKYILFTFITMGLLGLWHGSGRHMFHYMMFGFYHAGIMVIYRTWTMFRKKKLPNLGPNKLGYVLSCVLTYQIVCLGWPIFIHPTVNAISIYAKTFGFDLNFKLTYIRMLIQMGLGG